MYNYFVHVITCTKSQLVHDIYTVGFNFHAYICTIIPPAKLVSSASISGLYVILEAAFTIALLGVLLYKYMHEN
jgi:hypothetical protein